MMYWLRKKPSRLIIHIMISLSLSSMLFVGCSHEVKNVNLADIGKTNSTTNTDVEQLYIVDCLLPSSVRQLGTKLSYLAARRVIKTSGSDCAIRGGEYIAHDQASYQTTLKKWLPLAQAGDAKAQAYVGEIYEKGLGTQPNYQQAAQWYQQAANQGYARAQLSLGALYERGLGVAKDDAKALSLYRDASGLKNRQIEFITAAQYQAREKQSQQLAQTQNEKQAAEARSKQLEKEVQQLQQEVATLKQRPPKTIIVSQPSATKPENNNDNAEQKKRVAALEKKLKTKTKQLKKLQQTKNKLATSKSPTTPTKSKRNNDQLNNINFGNYYAVLIGNNDYTNTSNLKTAVNDASAIASVLKNQYGFKTITLTNASKGKMLAAFDSLRKKLTANDNLIIYYAGHGHLQGSRGFWLPSDSQQNNQKTWISNEQVTNFIDAMKAKHILVIADSCYSGTLSKSAIARPALKASKSRAWFDTVAHSKVRVVMSSGGIKPITYTTDGKHSVFAKAFLKALRSGNGNSVMEGASLFQNTRQQMQAAGIKSSKQNPLYAPIRFAGHEAGDFIFLKKGRIATLNKTQQPLFTLRTLTSDSQALANY